MDKVLEEFSHIGIVPVIAIEKEGVNRRRACLRGGDVPHGCGRRINL